MHCGYVVKVENLRPHSNADRLQVLTVFGNDTCVGLDVKIGDIGIYFPTDLQLSAEYANANNLVRKKDDAGNNIGGYMEASKRNVKTIRLRGEVSDGIYMPLDSLAFTGVDLNTLTVGTTIDVVNGVEICKKYIPRRTNRNGAAAGQGNRTRKKKTPVAPLYPYFVEHIDTPQLRFNLSQFKAGDIICLTEKVHGTSSRNGYCLVQKKPNLIQKIFKLNSKYKYKNVCGTRRTIVNNETKGFYGTNAFREKWSKIFEGKLYPGEQVFGEIAGFYDLESPIMNRGDNRKIKDNNFILKYGNTTTFSYGCDSLGVTSPLNKYFIYRMTYTSPEGYVIEYPWDLVKTRAQQMGFDTVPELERFIYTTEEDFLNRINKYLDIPSTIDNSHIIEGVVIRVLNSSNFKVAKEKSINFKILEGIIKEVADKPDMEEMEELL